MSAWTVFDLGNKKSKQNVRFYFEVIEREKLNLSNCLILGETRSICARLSDTVQMFFIQNLLFTLSQFNVSKGGDTRRRYMIVEYITRIYVLSFFTQKLMTILSLGPEIGGPPSKIGPFSLFSCTPPPPLREKGKVALQHHHHQLALCSTSKCAGRKEPLWRKSHTKTKNTFILF